MRTKSSIEDLYGSTVYLVSLRNKSLNYVLPRLSCKFSSWMARRRPWSRQPLSAAGHFNPCTFVLKFPCSGQRLVCNFWTSGAGSRQQQAAGNFCTRGAAGQVNPPQGNITSQGARRGSIMKWKTCSAPTAASGATAQLSAPIQNSATNAGGWVTCLLSVMKGLWPLGQLMGVSGPTSTYCVSLFGLLCMLSVTMRDPRRRIGKRRKLK